MEEHQLTVSGGLWVSIYYVQGTMLQNLIRTADMMQEIANDINKMKRTCINQLWQ